MLKHTTKQWVLIESKALVQKYELQIIAERSKQTAAFRYTKLAAFDEPASARWLWP